MQPDYSAEDAMGIIVFIKKLFWCFFCWKTETSPEAHFLGTRTLIIIPFGFHSDDCPLGTNNQLAEIAQNILQFCNPDLVVMPREISNSLCTKPGKKLRDIKRSHAGGGVFDIFKMVYRSLVFCGENPQKVAIIGHPRDVCLHVMIAKKIGLHVVIPDTSGIGYDTLSDRWWTKNVVAFTAYEVFERLYALFTGKI